MPVKNLSEPVICPLCHVSKKWGEMVKHIAYKGDAQHERWRIGHGFPAMIAFGTLKRHEPSLRMAIVKEFPQT